MERIEAGDLKSFGQAEMSNGYLVMLDEFSSHISRVITAVADGETVLFHCTAGKDRTGVVAMVLLAMSGVGTGELLDDYELTNRFAPHRGEQFSAGLVAFGLDPTDFETLWTAPRGVMRTVLNGLHDRWVDIDGYLRFAGVEKTVSDAARGRMLYDEHYFLTHQVLDLSLLNPYPSRLSAPIQRL